MYDLLYFIGQLTIMSLIVKLCFDVWFSTRGRGWYKNLLFLPLYLFAFWMIYIIAGGLK